MNNSSWSSPKVILSLIGMILLAGVVTVSIIRDRIVNNPQWTVSVTGHAELAYQPDTATVHIGVNVDRAATAEAALNQLTQKVTTVLKALKDSGIAESEIQTDNYSIYPQYDYVDETSRLAGYNANQQVSVKIKQLDAQSDAVSEVISTATKAGANQINGVSFETENDEALKQQARVLAIQDAQNKAQELAGAGNVKLKRIVGWWENFIQGPNTYPTYYDGKGGMGGGAGAPSTVPSGEQKIIIEMGVNYLVK